MGSPLGQLAERDHGDEDQPGDQHAEDHLLPLLRSVDLNLFLSLLGKKDGCGEERHAAATLADEGGMGTQCPIDSRVAG